MWYPLPPMTHQMSRIEKSEIFLLKPHLWSPKDLPTQFFCSAVFQGSYTCICNSNFWPNEVILTLRGRKVRKSKVKCGQNVRNFQNLLEVLTWHENNSVGQFRCETEIHEFFFTFDPFFPLMGIEILIAKYRQMTPQSTRNRMYTKQ